MTPLPRISPAWNRKRRGFKAGGISLHHSPPTPQFLSLEPVIPSHVIRRLDRRMKDKGGRVAAPYIPAPSSIIAARYPRSSSQAKISSAASSALVFVVSIRISGASGGWYSLPMPVKFSISPARALA